MKTQAQLEKMAEEYAGVTFEGLNKLGERRYSGNIFGSFRSKMTDYLAGAQAMNEASKAREDKLIDVLKKISFDCSPDRMKFYAKQAISKHDGTEFQTNTLKTFPNQALKAIETEGE